MGMLARGGLRALVRRRQTVIRNLSLRCLSAGLVVCLFALFSGTAFATDPFTLPDLGVDVSGAATAIGTGLGAIVAVCVGIAGAFLLIKYGLGWIRRTVK